MCVEYRKKYRKNQKCKKSLGLWPMRLCSNQKRQVELCAFIDNTYVTIYCGRDYNALTKASQCFKWCIQKSYTYSAFRSSATFTLAGDLSHFRTKMTVLDLSSLSELTNQPIINTKIIKVVQLGQFKLKKSACEPKQKTCSPYRFSVPEKETPFKTTRKSLQL